MKTIDRLRRNFHNIVEQLSILIGGIPTKYNGDNYVGELLIVGFPDYTWGEITSEQKNEQLHLKRKYNNISELLKVLLQQAPTDVLRDFEKADKRFLNWVELGSNHSITSNREENQKTLKKESLAIDEMLDILSKDKNQNTILIPDTNMILQYQDPIEYRKIISLDKFTFLILPTILGELDQLKILHRNPDVREKAKKIIKRIKGWRNQGSLQDGITIDKTILVKTSFKEPDMSNTLSWLDTENSDDRIIASVLDIQVQHPSSKLILATGDINLQNKADAAYIEISEF